MSSKSCDVSFVIVSWNARRHLQNCLVSLRGAIQNLETEIIVVDNASADGSPDMVRSEFPEVQLICNQDNTGFAVANNQGIELARGRYLCLVNSDVEVFPDTIERLLHFMEGDSALGVVGPKVLNTDGTLQRSCRTFPTLRSSIYRTLSLDTLFPKSRHFGAHFMTWWDYGNTQEVEVLSGCFWFIRRAALEAVGGLDTRFFMYGEDIDFCWRYHRAGWKLAFYCDARITHHGGASSANAPARFAIEKQRATVQYFLKHEGRFSAALQVALGWIHSCFRLLGQSAVWLVAPNRRTILGKKVRNSWACLTWLTRLAFDPGSLAPDRAKAIPIGPRPAVKQG